MSAIAAIGPATFDVFLAPKTEAAVATVASLSTNCGFVDEFHEFILAVNTKNPATAGLFKETQ
jgi:hypothetical protein